jgi:KDO2-lipid IV(A) lauroyltransferase
VKLRHAIEAMAAGGALAAIGALPYRAAVRSGAAVGDLMRLLGVRSRVARENLARAFPERSPAERDAILAAHWREVGRIVAEYGRLPRLARAAEGEVVADLHGLDALREWRGRGVILMSGHYGNFELLAARLARENPLHLLVQPQSNAAIDARLQRLRRESGVGVISIIGGVKTALRALRAGDWLALLGDQDARRQGVFVPYFGRLASTPQGPARLSLQAGVPMVWGAARPRADGRHDLFLDPPHVPDGPPDDERVRALTAWHTARLEARVREAPEHWFWLHRRWKTPPPANAEGGT